MPRDFPDPVIETPVSAALPLTPQPPEPSEPKPTLFTVLPYIMLPMALAAVDSTMVSTALPAIVSTLGGVKHVSWIVVGSLVSSVIAAPVYGQLRDVFGSRRMMLIALAIFMTGALLCSMATSLAMLVFCRILQGLGGGGLMTLSQAIIGETIPPLERARYQGYLAAVMVTATSLGPIIGGTLTTLFGWRSIFFFTAPVGLIAGILTLRGPARRPAARSWTFDYAGLALFIAFVGPFLIALDSARSLTPTALPGEALLLAISGAALVGLVWQERRAFFPLLPIHFLSDRTIWMSDALAACHGAALVSLFTLLPLYLHVMRGASASAMGAYLLPVMLGIGTGSMTTGRLVSRTGRTAIFPSVGLTVATLVLLNQAWNMDQWSRVALTISLLVAGASLGTIMGVVQVTVQSAAGRTALGSAAASVQISRTVGAAIGTTISSGVLFGVLQWSDPAVVPAFNALFEGARSASELGVQPVTTAAIGMAFRAAFLTIAGFTALGALIAWNIPRRHL